MARGGGGVLDQALTLGTLEECPTALRALVRRAYTQHHASRERATTFLLSCFTYSSLLRRRPTSSSPPSSSSAGSTSRW